MHFFFLIILYIPCLCGGLCVWWCCAYLARSIGLDSPRDNGLKLFLEKEDMERLYDFEEECVEGYFREQEVVMCQSTEERIKATNERVETMWQKIEDINQKENVQSATVQVCLECGKCFSGLTVSIKIRFISFCFAEHRFPFAQNGRIGWANFIDTGSHPSLYVSTHIHTGQFARFHGEYRPKRDATNACHIRVGGRSQ